MSKLLVGSGGPAVIAETETEFRTKSSDSSGISETEALELVRQVTEAIMSETGINIRRLVVSRQNDTVTLNGKIDTNHQRQMAYIIACRVFASDQAITIVNEIEVAKIPSWASALP
ncbi:hypothetical protein KKF55_04745 [Patescibacteria group bacterium]|nr:hypothetical protein [Patescibacteria group bacterium]